jgi:hypothetical protein
MISPKKSEYSKLIRNRYPVDLFRGYSYETRKIICNLFRSMFEGEISAEHKRKLINSSSSFSSYENYEIIKGKFKSSILKEDV